jgi:hypothetical protein
MKSTLGCVRFRDGHLALRDVLSLERNEPPKNWVCESCRDAERDDPARRARIGIVPRRQRHNARRDETEIEHRGKRYPSATRVRARLRKRSANAKR